MRFLVGYLVGDSWMMNHLRKFLWCLGIAAVMRGGPASAALPESVYSGAFVYQENSFNFPSNWVTFTNFEVSATKPVSIINYFMNWDNGSPLLFPTNTVNGIRAHGSIPLVSWQPVGNLGWQTYALSNIINGNFDSYINNWASAAKAWGNPFFLRFAHEMNGNWYPWDESTNGNSAGQYVLAWQHVHDIFTYVGVTNATWVWCVNTEYTGSTPIPELYPGDNYVDWISIDGYNRLANSWQDYSNIATATLADMTNLVPGKPIMIAETGSCEKSGYSKGQWFTNAMINFLPNSMPRIKAWVYFNSTNTTDSNDWRITTSADSLAGYQAGISQSYYSSNKYGSIATSPIPPLLNDATASDTMPPFVSIVSPQTTEAFGGNTYNITASASDKSGIVAVVFYTNGVIAATDSVSPYQFVWTAPHGSGATVTFTAQAYDGAGNSAISTVQLALQAAVALLSSDGAGASAFLSGTNWSNGLTPNATNDYFVGPGLTLNTPANNQTYTFGGDWLGLAGTLSFKQTNLITITNLQLTNGVISNGFAGGAPDMGRLGGAIFVQTNGVIDAGGNADAVTSLQIQSVISGNGGLTIQRPNAVILTATNTYSGPLTVAGSTLQLSGTASIWPSSLMLQNFVGSTINSTATNTVSAGSSLNVGYGPAGLLRVGYRNSSSSGIAGCVALLDVSAQAQFTANVGEFSVGNNTVDNDGFTTLGTVLLATNNMVTATNIFVGDSGFTGGGTNFLTLGGGSNYFSAPVMTVGARKENAQLTLHTGGVLKLDNAGGPANLTVGGQNWSTSITDGGLMDLSGGVFLANLGSLAIGTKVGGSTGGASGILTMSGNSANSVTAGSILIGSLAGASSGSPAAQGTLNFSGGSFVVSGNVILGSFDNGFGSATGTLNLKGGIFNVGGNISDGGGVGVVTVSGATLVLSGQAGTTGQPLSILNLTNASLHLNVNGGLATTNIVATTINAGGTTGIAIDSVTNVHGTVVIPLVSYTGSDPFSHLTLAALPAGYTGGLVDNVASHRIDLSVGPASPLISMPDLRGTSLIFQTTNSAAGLNYVIEATPGLSPANWQAINTNSGGGALFFTNPVSGTSQFFRVRVQ